MEKHIGLVTEHTHTIWVADVTYMFQLHLMHHRRAWLSE